MLRVGELAVELEAAGIELLWAGEHSHIPVSRDTERVSGGELLEYYARLPDPFVTLAVAAAVTTELKLGANVCLVTQRDPIQLAEEGRDARPRVRRASCSASAPAGTRRCETGHLNGKGVRGIEEPIGRIPALQRLAAESGCGPVPSP